MKTPHTCESKPRRHVTKIFLRLNKIQGERKRLCRVNPFYNATPFFSAYLKHISKNLRYYFYANAVGFLNTPGVCVCVRVCKCVCFPLSKWFFSCHTEGFSRAGPRVTWQAVMAESGSQFHKHMHQLRNPLISIMSCHKSYSMCVGSDCVIIAEWKAEVLD